VIASYSSLRDPGPQGAVYRRLPARAVETGADNFPHLLESLRLIWEKKLLIQSEFYRDENLKCFFDGATIAWHQMLKVPLPKNARLHATVTADPHGFQDMLIGAGIAINFEQAVSVLPAHENYIGDVTIDTLADVRRVFGTETITRSNIALPHGIGRDSGDVSVAYLYPGDKPESYGYIELPRIKFLLRHVIPVDPSNRKSVSSGVVS
jgi:hypothetical protein